MSTNYLLVLSDINLLISKSTYLISLTIDDQSGTLIFRWHLKIRAANLTYCSLTDRLAHGAPGLFDFKRTHRYCVQEVAFKSVKAFSPETSDEDVWKAIDKVFTGCYNDLEPFGRRPTTGHSDLKQSFRERFHYGYVYWIEISRNFNLLTWKLLFKSEKL